MRHYAIYVVLLCTVFCVNCTAQSGIENVKDYYFPYKNFSKTAVYTYINQNDTAEVNLWHMGMQVSATDTLFTTDIYDKDKHLSESLIEVITKEGASMQSYAMGFYDVDSVWIRVPTTIKQKDIYKWSVVKGDSYTWEVDYTVFLDLEVNESKTRNYTGEKTTIRFENKNVECLVFKDTFDIKYYNDGYTYTLTCYYGKGYGLLRYTANLPNGKIKDFKLVSTR